MDDITIRYDTKDLARMAARAPDIVAEEMGAGALEASLLAEREVRELTPSSGAGTLRDSIGALPVEISAERITSGVGTSLSYAAPVETGARPHWMPFEPLLDWVERKLGLKGPEATRVARAIRFKIAKRGTEGAHMFRLGFATTEPQIMDILAAAAARAAGRIDGGAE